MNQSYMGMTGRHMAMGLLAALAVANSGCLVVAAGAAAGAGAASYAYVKGKVSYTFDASFEDTWAAARKSLSELKLPILAEERETNRSGYLRSETADGTAVRVYLDAQANDGAPATGGTEVSVRIGTFGDYSLSDAILKQLSAHLVPVAPVGSGAGAGTPPPGSSWSAVNPGPVPTDAIPPVRIQPPAPPDGVQPGTRIAPIAVPAAPRPGPAPTSPPPLLAPQPMK